MKTVLISGASSGIGQTLSLEFSKNGWKVLMVARREKPLQDLQKQMPQSEYFCLDLAKKLSPEFHAWLSLHNANLVALVNNAGAYRQESVDQDQDDTWDFHYQANLMSAVRLTRSAWDTLCQNKGAILNITSTLAIRPIPQTGAYSALKAALSNWTQTLALEGAPHGVRANVIAPGIIDTPIHHYVNSDKKEDRELYQMVQGLQPLGRTGQPQDIAPLARQLCEPDTNWITGATLNIDGGILLKS